MMLRTVLIFLSLMSLLFGDAYQSLHYQRDFEAARAQAQKEGKLLMLMVVSDSCPWCKKLSRRTLKKAKIKAYIEKNFIPVLVKRDAPNTFPKSYQTPRIPTIFYINPKGYEVWTTIGFKKADKLYDDFKEASLSYIEELTGVKTQSF